jgi:hypothetical protein
MKTPCEIMLGSNMFANTGKKNQGKQIQS